MNIKDRVDALLDVSPTAPVQAAKATQPAAAEQPTDEQIVLAARRVGGLFDDLAISYQTDDILRFGRDLLASQAPAGVEAARLDWLLRHLPGDALRYCVGELADTADTAEFRAAIDRRRAPQGGA